MAAFEYANNTTGAARNFNARPGELGRFIVANPNDTAPGTYPGGPSVPVYKDPATGQPFAAKKMCAPDGTLT